MKNLLPRVSRILLVFAFGLFARSSSAQYVTITDPGFAAWIYVNLPSCSPSMGQLDTTCTALVTTTNLYLGGYTSMNIEGIRYFDVLETLDCSYNSLTYMPLLPKTLKHIDCYSNSIDYFTNMPDSLVYLDCRHNDLFDFPAFGNALKYLYADGNMLVSMSAVFPPGLLDLSMQMAAVNNLPVLPNSLKFLALGANPNLILPAVLPPALETFWVDASNLSALPPLPATLNDLVCSNNGILALPALPTGNMLRLDCSNTAISCLPPLPDSITYFYYPYMDVQCLPNYPHVTFVSPGFDTLPLCDLASGCPMGYNIEGSLYHDSNLDCSAAGENLLPLIPVKLYQSGILLAQSVSSYGRYAFDAPLGNYEVVIDTAAIPFQVSCVNPGIDSLVSLTAADSVAENVDFGFTCKPGFDLATAGVLHVGGAIFPGLSSAYIFNAGDASALSAGLYCNTTGVPGTVQITVSGPLTFTGVLPGSLVPTVTGSTFTYTIPDFSVVDPHTGFGLVFTTDTTATTGDSVCFSVSITAASGTELTTANNVSNQCYAVVNSYDPNFKEVSPAQDLLFPYNDWMTYTVHFQNTGTAPAINIRIKDTLDSDLDVSTFQLLQASHNVQTTVTGQNVEFRFNNIMLADSTSDEPGSHGYVQYRIKPLNGLMAGTGIENTAYIYFDFDTPIVTNTTMNHIVTGTGIETAELLQASLYPNPAAGNVTIVSSGPIQKVLVLNSVGQVVKVQNQVNVPVLRMDVSGLTKGMYLVQVFSGDGTVTKKLVKE